MNRFTLLVVAALMVPVASAAGTFTWTGAVSSDWFIPGNWNPPAVPGAADTAVINAGSAVVGAATSVAFLNLTGGSLTGGGVLTVGQTMTWTGGTVAGKLTLPAGTLLDIGPGATKYLNGGTISNAGTATWTGNENIYVQNGGKWMNEAGGQLKILGDAVYDYNTGDAGTFVNHGTVRKEGGTGTTTFDRIPFTNTGRVETVSGRILFPQGIQGGGVFVAGSGAVNEFNGAVGLADAVFSGEGVNRLEGATVTLSGEIQSENLEWNGGVLQGTQTVHGRLNWLAGQWKGQTTLAADATLTIGTGADKYLNGCTITNLGTAEWRAAQNLYIQNAAQWINETTGVFAIYSDAKYDYNTGELGSFVNRGLLRKESGAGTTLFDRIPLSNEGVIEIVQGVLSLNGDYLPGEDAVLRTFLRGPGEPADFGRLAVSGTAELDGALEVEFMGGFIPPATSNYPIVNAGRMVGTFASFKSDPAGTGLYLNPSYSANGVSLPMVEPAASVPPGMRRGPDGVFYFEVQGVAGQKYRIDASTELKSWEPLSTVVIPGSTVLEVVDPDAAGRPVRYYRVVFVP